MKYFFDGGCIKAKNVKADETQEIVIPALDLRQMVIHVVGDSPFICHAWSEKAKKEILDKQMKSAKTKKHDVRNPVGEFIESLYWLDGMPDGRDEKAFEDAMSNNPRFGFPSVAFKAAAISAGYRTGVLPNLVMARGAIRIEGEYVEIVGTPHMREDAVRLGGISRPAELRYRGEFTEWEAYIPVTYNAAVFSAEQVVNLFNLGGFACGVGEWRIEKGGTYGSFHVA